MLCGDTGEGGVKAEVGDIVRADTVEAVTLDGGVVNTRGLYVVGVGAVIANIALTASSYVGGGDESRGVLNL